MLACLLACLLAQRDLSVLVVGVLGFWGVFPSLLCLPLLGAACCSACLLACSLGLLWVGSLLRYPTVALERLARPEKTMLLLPAAAACCCLPDGER